MSYGIDENGFTIKPYDAILDSLKLYAKQYLGDDIALGVDSRLLRFLQAVSYLFDNAWQLGEDIYSSAYLDFATGNSLDFVVALIGFQRIPAAKATGKVTFHRDVSGNEITIPKSTRIATVDETIMFKTTEVITMGAADTDASGNIEAVLADASGNVTSSTITVIVDTVSGIDSVNNTNPTTGGRDKETDAELRLRVKTTAAAIGAGTLDAILARVRSEVYVPDVISAVIEGNDLDSSQNGLPAHSFRVTIYGGEDDDIAQAIFDTKPTGIRSFGDDSSGNATDQDDNEYVIYFRKATLEDIDASANVTTDGTDVSGNDIKDAIKAYINNLDISGNVIYNKVVEAVMSIAGVADAAVQIGKTSGSLGTSNITIADDEVAQTDDDKITINFV